jgi:hypothetical protein
MVYFCASQISALCGRNRYRDPTYELADCLYRYNRDIFDKLVKVYEEEVSIYRPNVDIILKTFPNLKIDRKKYSDREIYHQLTLNINLENVLPKRQVKQLNLISKDAKKQQEYAVYKQEARTLINQIITEDEPDILNNKLESIDPKFTSNVVMDRGTFKEDKAIDIIRQELGVYGMGVEVDKSHLCKSLSTSKGNTYNVGGRPDGYITYNDRIGIVEVKSRRDRIRTKKYMPIYDVDQLAVYAFLSELDVFYLAEYLRDEVYLSLYSKEELLSRWQQLKSQLDQIADDIYDMCKNPYTRRVINLMEQCTINV